MKNAMGRGVLVLLAAVAEGERDRLRERTKASMKPAMRRGKHMGRPRKLDPDKLDLAVRLIAEGKLRSVAAHLAGVGVSTLRRALNSKS